AVADVSRTYLTAWKSMIKAVAVYRDGSKLSQPLSSKAKKTEPAPAAKNMRKEAGCAAAAPPAQAAVPPVREAMRTRLPARRGGFVQEATVGGHKIFLRTGEYPDGSLGEIFIDMYKEGAAYRGILNCFAVLTSK